MELFEVREAGRLPRARDVLWLPVEPEMVLGERGGAAGGDYRYRKKNPLDCT